MIADGENTYEIYGAITIPMTSTFGELPDLEDFTWTSGIFLFMCATRDAPRYDLGRSRTISDDLRRSRRRCGLIANVALVNLLVAMFADTYQFVNEQAGPG